MCGLATSYRVCDNSHLLMQWRAKLLTVVVLLQSPQRKSVDHGKRIFSIDKFKLKLAPGPYIIERTTGRIFAVYRLYTDSHRAFLNGIVHETESRTSFREIRTTSGSVSTRVCLEYEDNKAPVVVPVPSRLYFKHSQRLPLVGVSKMLSCASCH